MKFSFVDVTNWFGGKSVFFAVWFFVVGVYLCLHKELDMTYIALAGAIQGLVALRSIADDYVKKG
jgi:hypothetical protein